MEARKPVFGKSNSVEDMQHVRLMALLQEHGMTLPPETYPLRGFARDGQTGWRTARALRHAESAGKVGASEARSHPVALAEVAGSECGESPSTFVNTLAAMCGRGPAGPLIEAPGRAIMTALFGFLQGFRP